MGLRIRPESFKKDPRNKGKFDPWESRQTSALPMEEFVIWAAYQGGKPNIQLLKELAGDCIRMAVQKTSGLQKNAAKTQMSWENWERVKMTIIAEAIMLVRSGLLDRIEGTERQITFPTKEEYPVGWDFLFNGSSMTSFKDYARSDTFKHLKPRGVEENIPALKELVARLQEEPVTITDCNSEFDGHNRNHIKIGIICEAVALVLSGALGEVEHESHYSRRVPNDVRRRGGDLAET